MIERAIREGPDLNRVDVALARGRDAGLGIGTRNAHLLVCRLRHRLGVLRFGKGLQLRRHRRSEEHTSELQSLMRISYAVFCLKKKTTTIMHTTYTTYKTTRTTRQ